MSSEEIREAKKKINDLSSRLYYCSDSGEGRKMRRLIEAEMRRLGNGLQKIGIFDY